MNGLSIRAARAGDGPALARLHVEFGEYYVGLDPADFRGPEEERLVEFIEADAEPPPDTTFLVAELDGEPVGALWARVVEPQDDACFQVNPNVGRTQLFVDYLVTGEAHRRR